jgi:hypothetical protein
MTDRNYSVGFGRPPRHTRFKAGQSGNPQGRPKGAKNLATILEQELNLRVTVTESGKRRQISKLAVIVKHLVNAAAHGELKAMGVLFNQLRQVETEGAASLADESLSREEDQLVMQSIIQRFSRPVADNALSSDPEQSEALPRDNDAEAS